MNKVLILILLVMSCSEIRVLDKESQVKKDDNVKSARLEDGHTLEPIYNTKPKENSLEIKKYCEKIDQYFKKYEWEESHCDDFSWSHVRNSHLGDPIFWYVFGDEDRRDDTTNVTMFMCGVHGDEITPIKFCFDLMKDLKNNPEIINDNLIIIAPIVTPDSFFKDRPTRTNARGVDINRNFPTKDWKDKALTTWRNRYTSDPRRYPGKHAMSEQETIFSVNLINRYKPQKIISVHAPLTLLDYDGPVSGDKHLHAKAAKELLIQMSHKSGKYKVANYPFFVGSLGNWAGNERKIPTYTLELPNSDWHKTDQYYKMFREALILAIQDNFFKEKLSSQESF